MMMMAASSSSSMVSSLTAAVLVHVAAMSILSSADTGNNYYDDSSPQPQSYFLNLPYGETYFHHPTGRCSDGRLLIDFFAQHMGIPLLKPYLGIKNGKIQDWNPLEEGVNFAVAGGCKEVLGSSEIGGNDFNYPLMTHKSVEEIRKDVPLVINEISSAINKLIDLGA